MNNIQFKCGMDGYISQPSTSPSLNLSVLEQENQNKKGTQHLNWNNEMMDLLMIGSLMFPPLDQSENLAYVE